MIIYTPSTSWIKFVIFCLSLASQTFVIEQKKHFDKDSIPNTKIAEEMYILLNGIEQWVTIKGERSKPIILFFHGGPGSPFDYAQKPL